MSFEMKILRAVLLACALTVLHGQQSNDDCMAVPSPIDGCVQFIYTNCENATFITDRFQYMDKCPMFTIFWDAPYYNLTLLFDSHLTKPYDLCVTPVACTKAYRTNDDEQEVPVDWDPSSLEPICFKTQRFDRPTMKFRFDAQQQTRCKRTFINFHYNDIL